MYVDGNSYYQKLSHSVAVFGVGMGGGGDRGYSPPMFGGALPEHFEISGPQNSILVNPGDGDRGVRTS